MLVVLFLVGVLLLLFVAGADKKHAPCEKKHSWAIRFDTGDKRGYLVCKQCGKFPGEDN